MEIREKKRWGDTPFCLLWTFVFGLLAHGFAYFNADFSHDALYQLTADDDLWQVSLGRFLQPVWRLVRGDVSAPWLLGALSLVCIALAARLVIELMGMRRPLWKVLTCALMTVSQTVTMLNATYGPWVDAFMLSMLLAVVSVWLLERGGGRGFVGGAVCLAASLALYQSYVSMALGLMLLLFMDRALRGRAEYPPRALFAWAGKAAAMALLAAALYWGGMQLALRLTGETLSRSYNSIAGALDFSLAELPLLLGRTCWRFVRLLAIPSAAQPVRVVAMNALLAALCVGLFLRRVWRARPGWQNALLAALAAMLLPFALNISFFFSKGVSHDLMTYAFVLVYLMSMQFEERFEESEPRARRPLRAIVAGAMCVILLSGTVYANTAYLKKDLESQSFDMLMTRVLDRVEQVEGYVPGETPVAFLGNFSASPLMGEDAFAGYWQTGLNFRAPVTHEGSRAAYFAKKLGYNVLLAPQAEVDAIAQSETARSMGVFPAADSVQMVDGCVCVRISPAED